MQFDIWLDDAAYLWEGTVSQWVGSLSKGSMIYSPFGSTITQEKFFNGCIYFFPLEKRQDYINLTVNANPEMAEKILYQGITPGLCGFEISIFDARLVLEGEKISEGPDYYKLKESLKLGAPVAEIIRNADPNDPDRIENNLQDTSFILKLRLLKGNIDDIKSGNAKVLLTAKDIFIEAKDIQKEANDGVKISILPTDE